MRFLFGFLLIVALLAGLFWWFCLAPIAPPHETFVVIPPGTGTERIAKMLQDARVIRSKYVFDGLRMIRGGTLKAGEYRFADRATPEVVYRRLQRGDVFTLSVTIPEGYNTFDIARAFETAKLAKASDFLDATRANKDLVRDIDPLATSLEGYLYPDTYSFAPITSVRQMQTVMVERFRQKMHTLRPSMPVHDLVTLASLIEKETGSAGDRGLVSSVFHNRLKLGMALDTDPSVVYAALLEGRYRGTIYASDLKADSAYNTYVHPGLPPGPICSPGAASLQAALNPPQTNYLYFVAGANGTSKFATSLDEHSRNVSEYRREQQAAGR